MLIDAMHALRPDAAPALSRLADDIISGKIDGPHSFSAAVKAELGGTILLDAIMMLNEVPATASASHVRSYENASLRHRLVEHSLQCALSEDVCKIPGCACMRGMIETVRRHAAVCEAPSTCITCAHWGDTLASLQARALPLRRAKSPVMATKVPARGPILATKVVRKAPGAKPSAATCGDAAAHGCENDRTACTDSSKSMLMLLARSALGELSAPSSPVNSPRNSPIPLRRPEKQTRVVKKARNADDGEFLDHALRRVGSVLATAR